MSKVFHDVTPNTSYSGVQNPARKLPSLACAV
jgi:hypothetical protein